MSVVICKLPKAGLGNQLFPLMKAYTFAELNKLPITITGYHQIKPGPYLRGEKRKRNYIGFFNFQKNPLAAHIEKLKLKKYKKYNQEIEPLIQFLNLKGDDKKVFIFNQMPHWDNYFKGLAEHRELVIELLWKIIVPPIIEKVRNISTPFIGVHIRMGDFRKLKEGEDFSQVGAVRTPEKYFIDTINSIRMVHGTDIPVTVFTDGFRNEFETLFKLKNINLIEGNSDLEDLLILSKSKIIVTSAGSTFSFWAAFLSDAAVILHPEHAGTLIRSGERGKLFEGMFDERNGLLVKSIKSI